MDGDVETEDEQLIPYFIYSAWTAALINLNSISINYFFMSRDYTKIRKDSFRGEY